MNPQDDSQNKVPQKQETQIQNIICDTNILGYSGSKKGSNECINFLQELLSRKFGLAISNITTFELLKGTDTAKEKEGISFLSNFIRYDLDDSVLLAAARLDNIYKEEKVNVDGIEQPDKIIAATAVLTGSIILTADRNGFPFPFFVEVEYRNIKYEIKTGHTRSIHICILAPNINLISEIFNRRK